MFAFIACQHLQVSLLVYSFNLSLMFHSQIWKDVEERDRQVASLSRRDRRPKGPQTTAQGWRVTLNYSLGDSNLIHLT